ncbi:MAG: DUF3857 and transglutaminase domain-containing protein [bacterium]|nr:DUF3857 and transglutaminase domain-containing protein [bacterium]
MSYSCVLRMVVVMALVLVLSAGSVAAQKFGKISDEEKLLGAPVDYPEANSMIVFDRSEIEISMDNIKINYHTRIKILTPEGIEEVGDQSVSYHEEYDKFKGFKAHTITPEGKKVKVEKSAIFEKTADEYREKTFSFPSLEVGSFIEYRYSVISKRFRYLRPWYFQSDIYTLKSQVAVTIPNGFTYNVQYQNVPPEFRKAELEEKIDVGAAFAGAKIRTFTWTRENLPPITDEPYMSARNDYRSALRFQLQIFENRYNLIKYQKTWPEQGERCQVWLDEYCNKDKEIKRLADEITAGLSNERDKSRAIHAFVADNFRTRNEYHNWYFMHDNIGTLLEEKHGTDEGKNVLLCELHNAAGIPAFPVLISRRSHGQFYSDFAYLPQFDYVIAFVQLGNEYEFLDVSSKFAPYGVLPPDCLTSGGLLVDEENSQLVRIRQKPMYSGRTDRTRVHVAADGTAACTTSCNFRGYYASLYGKRHESNDPDEFATDYFLDKMDVQYILGQHQCELDTASEFVFTMDYSSDELVEQLDENLIVKTVRYAYCSNPFESENRFFPVDFQYPFTYRNVMEIVVEGDVQESVLPQDLNYSCQGATFERKTTVKDSMVVVDTKLIVEKTKFLPNQYQQLRRLFGKIALSSEDEVAFVKAPTE